MSDDARPAYGTRDYGVWQAGARAEAAAREEGIPPQLKELVDFTETRVKLPSWAERTPAEVADVLADVFTAHWSRWWRMRWCLTLARKLWRNP